MEPTPAGAVEHPHDSPPPVSPPPPHRALTIAALLGVVALVAGVIGVAALRGHDDGTSGRPLVLVPSGRSPEKGLPVSAGTYPGVVPYRFRLAITAPNLGATAAVARLEAPTLDAGKVRSVATALGVTGTVREANGGWEVVEPSGSSLLLEPTAGAWAVSFSSQLVPPGGTGSAPGAVPGSTGSTGSGSTPGASGTGGIPVPDPSTPPSSTIATLAPTPTTAAVLPDHARAEQIARSLLERMGVTGNWAVTVTENAGGDVVVCSSEPCGITTQPAAATLAVELRPIYDGVTVDGLGWNVELGNHGRIESVSGTWTQLRNLGGYPLRSVAAVFADLVAGRGIDPEPVPVVATEPGTATPFHEIQPVAVAIDHVALGYRVVPASDHGEAVVDVVPAYEFSGHTTSGVEVSRTLVAVSASIATPGTTVPPATVPPNSAVPAPGVPQPEPIPVIPPTVAGKPPT